MMNSPTFHVAKESTKQAKSLLATFLGLLDSTIKHRVMFMVKAKAAGKAKMFMEFVPSRRLTARHEPPTPVATISYFKKGKRSTPGLFPISTGHGSVNP
jgi:hypothetical protein